MKSKKFLIVIDERNGEREYSFPVLAEGSNGELEADRIAKNWYSDADAIDESEDAFEYTFSNGEISASVRSVKEVPESEFKVLVKYLNLL